MEKLEAQVKDAKTALNAALANLKKEQRLSQVRSSVSWLFSQLDFLFVTLHRWVLDFEAKSCGKMVNKAKVEFRQNWRVTRYVYKSRSCTGRHPIFQGVGRLKADEFDLWSRCRLCVPSYS